MMNPAQSALPRIRIAFALFLLNAIVTLPWAFGNWGASPAGIVALTVWLSIAAVAVPIASGKLPDRVFWILLPAALVASRLAALSLIDGRLLVGDPQIYEMLARSLLSGSGLIFHDPLTQTTFRALYPPAYPLFLAGLGYTLGFGASTYSVGNVVIDLASALILVRLGAHLGSPAAGRAAAWLFAIWPAFVLAAPFAQKESLVTLEVLTIALVLVRAGRERAPHWRDGALLGLASGALALTQPGLALFPVILGVVLLPAVARGPLQALALRALPFALLVLAPWWIRNFYLFGTFVPLTTTGGLGLWVGNNPDATGGWMPMPAAYRGMSEMEMSARAARDALDWIASQPLDFVKLTLFKLFHAMGIEQFTLGRLELMTPKPGPATLAALFPLLQGSLIALLAGVALLGRRLLLLPDGERLILILCGCAAQILFLSLPFEFGERHRWFLMPFLFLVVAAGLCRSQNSRAVT